MSQTVEVGTILEGKVTAIKPFGAFVAINDSQQGLVHISQVAHSYVKEVGEHLSVGDVVKVKVLSVDPNSGKISLSIKEATERPAMTVTIDGKKERNRDRGPRQGGKSSIGQAPRERFNSFEDQMKKWLKHSEENLATLNKKHNR
jgi:general stress protein 13/S1 RNA binding domain protein